MANSVFHNWRELPISIYINIIALLLVASACSQMVPSSPSLSGHLLIVGSTALQPLVAQAATQFEKDHPQVHIDVRGGGSLFGLQAATEQQADIGDSDVYADPVLYPEPNLIDHIVCIVPFTMIVHPDVPVTSLTQQAIVNIFTTGEPHNWNEFGGPNLPVIPVIRTDTSGTRASFLKYVLGGMSEQKGLRETASSSVMLDTVAHTPGAIGYMGLPSLNTSVHTLAIDDQTATVGAIVAGKYAFWGYEHMYSMSNNRNPVLPVFLQFMLSSKIQEQAQRMKYIPMTQVEVPATATPQRKK